MDESTRKYIAKAIGLPNPTPKQLADALMMTHQAKPSLESLKGHDALTDWGIGVADRITNPQRLSEEAQRWQQMNPEELAMQFTHGGGVVGTFIGKNAKTFNHAMQDAAQKMEAAGHTPEAIWKETGTFKGADGHWRQEIDDSGAQVNNLPIKQSWEDFSRDIQLSSGSTAKQFKEYKKQINARQDVYNLLNRTMRPVEDIYSHPSIYSQYPDLVNLSAHHRPEIGLSGAYGGGKIEFGDVSNPEGVKGLFGHELQHAIQQREGWARGGSPEMFSVKEVNHSKNQAEQVANYATDKFRQLPEDLQGYARAINRGDDITGEAYAKIAANPQAKILWADYLQAQSQVKELLSSPQNIEMLTPSEQYKRLAGEAEARLTQARMNMTPEQRAASYPPSMFDVPIGNQIVRADDERDKLIQALKGGSI